MTERKLHKTKNIWQQFLESDLLKLFSALHRASPWLCKSWWLLIIVSAFLQPAMILCFGWVVANIANDTSINAPLITLGIIFITSNGAGALKHAISANLGTLTAEWLHNKLFDACLKPDGIAHLEKNEIASDLEAARDFDLGVTGAPLAVSMPRIGDRLSNIGSGLIQACILFAFSWWAPLILAGAWLSTNIFLSKSSRWDNRFTDDVVLEQRKVRYNYELMVDSPAAKEVRIFGLSSWLCEIFRTGRFRLFDKSWRERRFQWPSLTHSTILVVGANLLVFSMLASSGLSGNLELSTLIIFIQATIGTAQLGFDDDYFLRTAAQPIPLVFSTLDTIEQSDGNINSGTLDAIGKPEKEIRFENISFNYPSSKSTIIKNFNLSIPAGTSIAIVGKNGVGKTTLMKLLGRLYEPTSGTIRIDGEDISGFNLFSWRCQIALLFQDFIRYDWSLRDNVDPESIDDEIVQSCLKSAGADKLTDLDSIMSRSYDDSAEVSGGQWQRIALARVFAKIKKGANLIILDEPTAQLDIKGEELIINKLLEETKGLTTIIISHRFSTVRKADQICVIDNGQVAELGNHHELMARGGIYKRMFEIQSSRFNDSERANL